MQLNDSLFVREGEYWTIAYEGRVFRLRDAKGLHYLALLLRHPGESLPVGEMLAAAARRRAGGEPPDAERMRLAVTKRIKTALAKIRENHPALGEHLVATVRTGRACVYAPDRARSVNWTV